MPIPREPYIAVSDIKSTSCKFHGAVLDYTDTGQSNSGRIRAEYRNVTDNGSWINLPYATTYVNVWTVTNLVPGNKYAFRLHAQNSVTNESINSPTYYFRTFPKLGTVYMPNGQRRNAELTVDIPYITQNQVNINTLNYFLLPFGFAEDQCVVQMWFSRASGPRPSYSDDFLIITAQNPTSSQTCFKFESTIRQSTLNSVAAWRDSWTNAVHTGENGVWERMNSGSKWSSSDINIVDIHLSSNQVQECGLAMDWIGGQTAMWPGFVDQKVDAPPVSGIWANAFNIKGANADRRNLYLNMNYRLDNVNRPYKYPIYIYRIRLTMHSGADCPPAISLYDLVPVKAGSTQYLPTPPTKDCFFDLCGQNYIYSNGTVKYGTHKRRVVPLSFSRDSNGNQVVRRIK